MMNDIREKIELKEIVNDSNGNQLDSQIIGKIITYLYGESKSFDSIAQYMDISPVKLHIYMDYLNEKKIAETFEEKDGDEIKRKYRICSNMRDLDVNVKIDSNLALLQYADELCSNLKNSIMALDSADINELSYYIGEVPVDALRGTISSIQRLQSEVEETEKRITEKDKSEKYMLITAFVPYKEG